MKQVLVLLGAKGSGKSSIGRLLERAFGLKLLRTEGIWVEHAKSARGPSWQRDGFRLVARALSVALAQDDVVVTETTGASLHTAELLEALRREARVRVLRIDVPPAVCLERVRARDAAGHVPVSDDDVARVNALASASDLHGDASFVNVSAWDEGELRRVLQVRLAELGIEAAPQAPRLQTERLVLRGYRDEDRQPFAEMNADLRVTEFLSRSLNPEQSDDLLAKLRAHFQRCGFGLWAVEVPGVAPFIGFVGLNVPHFEAVFTPCIEIGWRLAAAHWGQGYATEAARRALAFAFEELLTPEIVSFTVPDNQRSQSVMQKLGMTRTRDDDFDHPELPEGHPRRRHVLYRLSRSDWRAGVEC